MDKATVLGEIEGIKKINGDTCLGESLKFFSTSMMTQAAGSRLKSGIPQKIFVMTDGQHNCGHNMLQVSLVNES